MHALRRAPAILVPASPPLVRATVDVTTYLTIWLVLLCGISAYQVVRGVGAIGSPAMLWVLPSFLIWVTGWVLPESGLRRERHPVRALLLCMLAYQLLSYAVAMARPVTPLEMTGSVRALLTAVAMTGVGLLVADGVADEQRLHVLLRRLVFGASFVAMIGILEFFSGARFEVLLPGLEWNRDLGGLGARSIFNRPSGTTMHPIEMSVVTAAVLPLGIHFGLYDLTRRARLRAGTATAVIAFAVPLSISRSGVVSLAVALFVMFAGWSWRRRAHGALVVLGAVPLLWATIPGLVGTMINLFADIEADTSVQARLDRVPRIMMLIRARPLLGLGNGTFSVQDYFLLDNQFYATAIEMGMIGIVLVLLLLTAGIVVSLGVRGFPTADERTRHLALAIGASIAGLSISIVTFDSFFYRILTGSLYLLIGAAGALWRIHRASER